MHPMTSIEDVTTLIQNARVFDGTGVSTRTCVLIEGGRIVAVEPDLNVTGYQVVDGTDRVLLPGFIDAHVHLHGVENLEQLARAGVTTALDMACWPRELVDDLRHRPGLTDIRSAGIPATAPGSTHSKMPGRPEAALVAGPADAEAFVSARVAEGSDYIKLIADVPGPDQATLDALVRATHARGKLAVAHAATLTPFQMAAACGADIITHAPLDGVLDDSLITKMRQHACVAVPTLSMMQAVAARFFGPSDSSAAPVGPGYHNARRSVGLLHRAGVPILAGTDANATEGVPANIKHGESLHTELELLVDAGLRPVEAIAAATTLPARHFGLTDRGTVTVGLRADLVLVAGDPLADIADTRNVERVWCAGVEHIR